MNSEKRKPVFVPAHPIYKIAKEATKTLSGHVYGLRRGLTVDFCEGDTSRAALFTKGSFFKVKLIPTIKLEDNKYAVIGKPQYVSMRKIKKGHKSVTLAIFNAMTHPVSDDAKQVIEV